MDPAWEFNCPQFVDFTQLPSVDEDDADKFFDTETNLEHIGGPANTMHGEEIMDSILKTPLATMKTRSQKKTEVQSSEATNTGPTVMEPSDHEASSSEDDPEEHHREQDSQQTKAKTPKEQRRHMRTYSTPNKPSTQGATHSSSSKPPQAPRSAHKERPRSASCSRPQLDISQDSVCSTQSEPMAKCGRTGVPPSKPNLMSPSVLRKRLGGSLGLKTVKNAEKSAKSSEELELERIQQMRQEFGQKKKQYTASYQKAMWTSNTLPEKHTVPATKPKEFTFASDQRIKNHQRGQSAHEPKEFMRTLRSSGPSQPRTNTDGKPVLTVPQPFKFNSRKRKNSSDTAEPLRATDKFKSMAEQITEFSKKTPDRFRTRRSGGPSPPKKSKVDKVQVTIPKTPNLSTKTRLRPTTVISQAEIEEREIEEIKKYKFKAKPVNEKIFSQSNLGVKPVPVKQATVPIGFDLETERRREMSASETSLDQEEKYEFHARPVPKSVLHPPPLKRPSTELQVTVPESPAFALKHRLRPRPPTPEQKEEKKFYVRPPLHVGVPFMPKLSHKTTEIEPFSFDQRTEEMRRRKEMLIQKQLEEEKQSTLQAREFHANPMPDLSSPDHLPSVKHKSPTIPEPFELSADVQGIKRAEEWAHKMEEEMMKQRELAAFKARPAIVTKVKPFEPKKSSKPLTDINDFELNTQRRAEDRLEFEKWKAEKEQEIAALQEQRQRELEEQERQEIERLRQEATVKAQPIRHYKPVQVMPSDKPLTQPSTPRFSERLRRSIVRM